MSTALVTVRDYLRVLFRRKHALLIPFALGILLVGPLWVIIPSKYRAVALVRRQDLVLTSNAAGNLMARGTAAVPVSTLRVEILTWTNLDRVVRQLKLDVDLKTAADWQREYKRLQKSVTIRAAAEGHGVDLIEIAAIDSRPVIAQKIANAVADNYVEESQRASRADTQTAVKFFSEGANQHLEKLRSTEIELDRFNQEHFTDLPDVKKGILDRLLSLRMTESTDLLLLSAAQNRLAEIQRQIAQAEKIIKAETTSQENPARVELENQLTQRKRLLEAMLVKYTAEHPQVKAVEAEIETIEQQLEAAPQRVPGAEREVVNPVYQQLVMDKMKAEQEIQAQQAALLEIKAQILANEAAVRKVVNEEKRYADLQRLHRENLETYDQYRRGLVATRTRLQVQNGPYGTQVEMIDRAQVPATPYRLERLQIALACIGAAAAGGIGLMFLLEFMDHSLRGAEDAASSLAVPVLATLTEITALDRRALRRRKLLRMAGIVSGAIMLCVVGVLLFEYFQPNTLRGAVGLLMRMFQ